MYYQGLAILVIIFRRYDNFVMNVVKVQEDAIYILDLTLLLRYLSPCWECEITELLINRGTKTICIKLRLYS